MKNLLIYISLVTIIASCDNRNGYIETTSKKPTINIYRSGDLSQNSITNDTVKITSISTKKNVSYVLSYDGNSFKKDLLISLASGTGKLVVNGDTSTSSYSITLNGSDKSSLLTYVPISEGNAIITVRLTDNFENTVTQSININSFRNYLPVPTINMNIIGVNDPNEYSIDASSSFDADNKYGGNISKYTYSINGRSIIGSNSSSLKWIFGSSGTYSIKLVVTDNDNATTETTKIVSIN